MRRGAQDVGQFLRRRDPLHQALSAGTVIIDIDAPLPANDGDAAQRQGRGLPTLHGTARQRPLRGPLPRWRPRGRCLGLDAAHGQGAATQVRWQAIVPRAHRLHSIVPALRGRSPALRSGHRLCAGGIQSGGRTRQRQAGRHGRLRPDDPPATACLVSRGNLPVTTPTARAFGGSSGRVGGVPTSRLDHSPRAQCRRHRRSRRRPRGRGRSCRNAHPRPSDRRPLHRRTEGGNRHSEDAGRARAGRPSPQWRREVAGTCKPAQ